MKCYILSSDLMFGSQVSSAARECGFEVQTIRYVADVDTNGPSQLVIVDLNLPGLDIAATTESLELSSNTRVIAIGPHVHAEKLSQAKASGAIVMTKGEAHRNLAARLKELASE